MATLTGVKTTFSTHNDNKDHDTRLDKKNMFSVKDLPWRKILPTTWSSPPRPFMNFSSHSRQINHSRFSDPLAHRDRHHPEWSRSLDL
jgi:hypothetical protein